MNLVTVGTGGQISQVVKDRNNANSIEGFVGEWIVWSDALDSDQITALEANQAAAWGI